MSALLLVGLVGLFGCPKPTPEHLRLDPKPEVEAAEQSPIRTSEDALWRLVGSDPLVRAPRLSADTAFSNVPETEPILAYFEVLKRLEQGSDADVGAALEELEGRYPGTAAVALSRGYRLRVVETLLARLHGADAEAEREVLSLLTPFTRGDLEANLPQAALHWVASDIDVLRHLADRWVLTGWLDGPGIPLQPVASALGTSQYDGLRDTQIGQLVVARAEEASSDLDWGPLEEATHLALARAAADRDNEQAAWSDLKAAASKRLEVDDPIAALLQASISDLTAGAGDPDKAGGALLAIAASRWTETCADVPCVGFDKARTLSTAGRWGPKARELSAVWQVIALKESLDTMDVGHETVLFPKAMQQLADAMLGVGAGPIEAHVILRKRPDPAVWLTLGRAAGAEAATDWIAARNALGKVLEQEAREARDLSTDDAMKTLLKRIISRAIQ